MTLRSPRLRARWPIHRLQSLAGTKPSGDRPRPSPPPTRSRGYISNPDPSRSLISYLISDCVTCPIRCQFPIRLGLRPTCPNAGGDRAQPRGCPARGREYASPRPPPRARKHARNPRGTHGIPPTWANHNGGVARSAHQTGHTQPPFHPPVFFGRPHGWKIFGLSTARAQRAPRKYQGHQRRSPQHVFGGAQGGGSSSPGPVRGVPDDHLITPLLSHDQRALLLPNREQGTEALAPWTGQEQGPESSGGCDDRWVVVV